MTFAIALHFTADVEAMFVNEEILINTIAFRFIEGYFGEKD